MRIENVVSDHKSIQLYPRAFVPSDIKSSNEMESYSISEGGAYINVLLEQIIAGGWVKRNP